MSDDETPRPELKFSDTIDYYESTDFAQISGEVANDGWIGTGDAMVELVLLRSTNEGNRVHLPVQVDDGPVTRGARFFLALENVTRGARGETQISLIDVSGADASGATEWSVEHWPIRDPFEDG
jgi:hypothetical protein